MSKDEVNLQIVYENLTNETVYNRFVRCISQTTAVIEEFCI